MAIQEFRDSFKAMGSRNELSAFCRNKVEFQSLFRGVVGIISDIEATYSRFIPTSIVSRINLAAGSDWIDISEELSGLLDYAEVCWHQSNGLFDLTSGVLRHAWNFETKRPPNQEEVEELLPYIGWEKVERRPGRVKLAVKGMQLDLGGVGKEFAVDKVLIYLRERGLPSAMLNLGGDIGVLGPKPDGSSWQIGIRDPRAFTESIATIALSKGGLATSGDYERFFELDGKRFCHILNAKTGFPVQELQSVSVAAPSCLVAGSLTTISMLVGREKALELLKQSAFPYLIIDSKGAMHSNTQNHCGHI